MNVKFSICTTNYNCGNALKQHLDSIYSLFDDDEFEYLVVDNKSRDNSLQILREYEKNHKNMRVFVRKCTMGRGRQLAFEHSSGKYIIVVDTDTVYYPIFARFVDIYFEKYKDYAVQAIYCGIFPRGIWIEIGGRNDLNQQEDLDMWMRIWKIGKMRWYPIFMGENLKDLSAKDSMDYLSERYGRFEKIRRLIRGEYDMLRTSKYQKLDLRKIWMENVVDLGLGKLKNAWFESKPRRSIYQICRSIAKESYKILKA
jgi:glycosyltransferase involved in cell wall biosynthesis